MRSSAYEEVEALACVWSNVMPKCECCVSLRIRGPMLMLNKSCNKGHPCLTPPWMCMGGVYVSSTVSMYVYESVCMFWMSCVKMCGRFRCVSVLCM